MERGGALLGDALADHVGLAGFHAAEGFLQRQVAAGVIGAVKAAGVLLGGALFAEAVVRAAFFHQQTGILAVGIPAFRLDIRSHGTAHIGALVVGEAALRHGAVDHIGGTLHQTTLIGVLNTQNERAALGAGDKPRVQSGA